MPGSEFEAICAAILPVEALPALGVFRARPGVLAAEQGERVLVRWEAGQEDLTRLVAAQNGVDLFVCRDGLWHRPGASLPAFEASRALDSARFRTLARVLVPRRLEPVPARAEAWEPARLRLVRDDRFRAARGLRTSLDALERWADRAWSSEFEDLEAAESEGEVFVLGRRLPAIGGAERYWGEGVLAPLGWRPEPGLPEGAIRSALAVEAGALVVIEADGVEVIPREAFRPLTRGSVRLARENLEP